MISSSLNVFPSPDTFLHLIDRELVSLSKYFPDNLSLPKAFLFFLKRSKVGERTVKSTRNLPRRNSNESLFEMRTCLLQRRHVKCVVAKCKIPRRCDSQSMPSCLSFKPSRNLSWNNVRIFLGKWIGVTSKRDSSEIKSVMAFIRASLGV